MKTLSYFSLLFAIFSLLSCFGCKETPEKQIVGTWKIARIESTEQIADDQRIAYQRIWDEMKESSKLIFHNDNTVETKYGEQLLKGIWAVSRDGKTLILKMQEGTTATYFLKEFAPDKIKYEENVDNIRTLITLQKQ